MCVVHTYSIIKIKLKSEGSGVGQIKTRSAGNYICVTFPQQIHPPPVLVTNIVHNLLYRDGQNKRFSRNSRNDAGDDLVCVIQSRESPLESRRNSDRLVYIFQSTIQATIHQLDRGNLV